MKAFLNFSFLFAVTFFLVANFTSATALAINAEGRDIVLDVLHLLRAESTDAAVVEISTPRAEISSGLTHGLGGLGSVVRDLASGLGGAAGCLSAGSGYGYGSGAGSASSSASGAGAGSGYGGGYGYGEGAAAASAASAAAAAAGYGDGYGYGYCAGSASGANAGGGKSAGGDSGSGSGDIIGIAV